MNLQFLLGAATPFVAFIFLSNSPQPPDTQPVPATTLPAAVRSTEQAPFPTSTPSNAPTITPTPDPVLSGESAAQSVFHFGTATGWKLNQDDLGMTAAHMLEETGESGTVRTDSGLRCQFSVIKKDDRLDLVLLKLDGECASMPGLPVSTDIKQGDAMTAIGFPTVFGARLAIKEGTIKAIGTISKFNQPDVEASDQVLYGGMSGGPCFTAKGVFGVVSNGSNPMGQIRPGDRGWCAEIPEGWMRD